MSLTIFIKISKINVDGQEKTRNISRELKYNFLKLYVKKL